MKVLISGLPLFSEQLCSDLNNFDQNNSYAFYNTYYSKKDQIKFATKIPFADLFISFNGVSDKSGSLELACKFNKKIIMQWHGTDVKLAKERTIDKSIFRKYIDKAIHFTDAPWLKDELNDIGIDAEILQFKSVSKASNNEPYSNISAYTYLGQNKERFYGWDILLETFKNLPNSKLFVYGCNGKNIEATENIIFKGWLNPSDYQKEIGQHPIFIRLTEHDGFSLSVLDALSHGAEVIWNYPITTGYLVERNSESVFEKFIEIKKRLEERKLERNFEAINWVTKAFNKETIIENYIKSIIKG